MIEVNDWKGLRLRKEKKYTPEEVGLSMLLFDEDESHMVFSGISTWLKKTYCGLGLYNYKQQVEEKWFDRIILPVYMIRFDVLDGNREMLVGCMQGVISPQVDKTAGDYIKVLTEIPPQFHFIQDFYFQYYKGASYTDQEYLPKALVAGALSDTTRIGGVIDSCFRVSLPSQKTPNEWRVLPVHITRSQY